MRFAVFDKDGRSVVGFLDNDEIVDLSLADATVTHGPPGSPAKGPGSLHQGGAGGLPCPCRCTKAASRTPLSPPIQNAGKYFCLGLNYTEHRGRRGIRQTHLPHRVHPL